LNDRQSIAEIYSWASALAAESRDPQSLAESYVWPRSLIGISDLLDRMRGGLIGIIGLQGVGKSTALMVLDATEKVRMERRDVVFFKWRRQKQLFKSLLDRSHEASEDFLQEYGLKLVGIVKSSSEDADPVALDSLLQRKVGRSKIESLRGAVWIHFLRDKRLILIDTPDYSKTDRRAMATDLGEIYWLWNNLARTSESEPNIVVAIQKEMSRGHFFFDKMHKIELEPLEPRQMVEAFMKRFRGAGPFTDDALLTLARVSRGVFRRFLRYITLTLNTYDAQQTHDSPTIGSEIVRKAVTNERLAEDMDLELAELFPKHSDMRLIAVQLLMRLEESGPANQTDLADQLGLAQYALSRLLAKLELHRYVTRERSGTDKIVSSTRTT